ncbi:MAG: hypothetical protein GY913_29730 [Proteobacteria bacterium]|nr:hypothetical protein [Pseudomonadota bacterium]MCP4921096.1 hypothetical protein [Pseudomonadota bacterium]
MKWTSTITTEAEAGRALIELLQHLADELPAPDLLLVFVSPHYEVRYDTIGSTLKEHHPNATVIGCSGGSVIGGGFEVENEPAIALLAAQLPDVGCVPFRLRQGEVPSDWRGLLGLEPEHEPAFILLPDPLSTDPLQLIASLDDAYPGAVKVGGLASGGTGPEENALFLDGELHHDGCVGVALYGDLVIEPLVAQGCRPLGQPMKVTRGRHDLVFELDGRSALEILDEVFTALKPDERPLFAASPMVGMAMADSTDFLIRHVVGVDRKAGVVAIGASVTEGAMIQFHLRDPAASSSDLRGLLAQHVMRSPTPVGALMFSCMGRGVKFYGKPDHDSALVREHVGDVPMGGFFGNGELGPVHGRTWLHGYTTSIAFVRPRGWS